MTKVTYRKMSLWGLTCSENASMTIMASIRQTKEKKEGGREGEEMRERDRDREREMGMVLACKTSNPSPRDTLPPKRSHFPSLILLKQGMKHSNI